MKFSQKSVEQAFGGTLDELTRKGKEKLVSDERKIAKILAPIFNKMKSEYNLGKSVGESSKPPTETQSPSISKEVQRKLLYNLGVEQRRLVGLELPLELVTNEQRSDRLCDIDNITMTISSYVEGDDITSIIDYYDKERQQIQSDLENSKIMQAASDIKEKHRLDPDGGDPSDLFITPKIEKNQIIVAQEVDKATEKTPSKLSNSLKDVREFAKSKTAKVGGLLAIGVAALLTLKQGQMPEVAQNPANPETNIQTTEMIAEQKPLGKALRPPSRPSGENKPAVAATEKSKIANTEAEAKTRVSFYRETDNNINTSVSQISEEINWDLALKVFDGFDKDKTFSREFRRAGGYEGLKKIGSVIESDARNGIKTVEINMPRFKSAPIIPVIKK